MTDTFTTPNGTYGITMKPNAIFKWVMAQQAKGLKKPNARRAAKAAERGIGTLLLRTTGRKSGRPLETPVAYFPQADGSWLVCASAGGAAKHPSWYFNLKGSGTATVWVNGEEIPVNAVELHGEERAAAWSSTFGTKQGFVGYTTKTDRELPVVRLIRAS